MYNIVVTTNLDNDALLNDLKWSLLNIEHSVPEQDNKSHADEHKELAHLNTSNICLIREGEPQAEVGIIGQN